MGQQASRFDQGGPFRTQATRDVTDIDLLMQRKEQLRQMIPKARAEEIELRPDTVIDGEGFRIAHANGRWNATLLTPATIFGGATAYSVMTK